MVRLLSRCGHIRVRPNGQPHQADKENRRENQQRYRPSCARKSGASDGRPPGTRSRRRWPGSAQCGARSPVEAKDVPTISPVPQSTARKDQQALPRVVLEGFRMGVAHRSGQVKHREQEDPDEVHKMPEQPGDFDAVGEAFRIGEPHLAARPQRYAITSTPPRMCRAWRIVRQK